MSVQILTGDCLDLMRGLPDASVDAVVTDPPYGLSFMGKLWDHGVPGSPFWAEALRVAKPGAHLLAFGGNRTHHRLFCAIEDAGWEIRDEIDWIFGSGFPKSKNLGDGWGTALKPAKEPICVARKPFTGSATANFAAHGTGGLNIDACRVPAAGESLGGGNNLPGVDRSQKHEGWRRPWMDDGDAVERSAERSRESTVRSETLGRWPANVIHDGSDEVLAAFLDAKGQQGDLSGHSRDRTSRGIYGDMPAARDAVRRGDTGSAARFFYAAKASRADREQGLDHLEAVAFVAFQTANGTSGKASSLSEGRDTRYRNIHPTVKPTELMRYLCRLVTPPGGTVLDPFMGSGSTGKAAALDGFDFIGMEMDPSYVEIATARIAWAEAERARQADAGHQMPLFEGVGRGMTDLFLAADTRARLALILPAVAPDPATAVRAAMREGTGFSHGGSAGRHVVAGFGVLGRGETFDAACRDWVRAARGQGPAAGCAAMEGET